MGGQGGAPRAQPVETVMEEQGDDLAPVAAPPILAVADHDPQFEIAMPVLNVHQAAVANVLAVGLDGERGVVLVRAGALFIKGLRSLSRGDARGGTIQPIKFQVLVELVLPGDIILLHRAQQNPRTLKHRRSFLHNRFDFTDGRERWPNRTFDPTGWPSCLKQVDGPANTVITWANNQICPRADEASRRDRVSRDLPVGARQERGAAKLPSEQKPERNAGSQ